MYVWQSDAPLPGELHVPLVVRTNLWAGRAAGNAELLQARATLRMMVAAFASPACRGTEHGPQVAEALAASDLVLRSALRY